MRTTFVLAGLVAIAPDAAAQDSRLPLSEGATWTYTIRKTAHVGGMKVAKEGAATLTCKSTEKVEGVAFWVLAWEETTGKDTDRCTIWLREDGDRIVFARTDSDHTPLLPVDFSKKEGRVKVRSGRDEIEVASAVGDEEEIETTAGTFKAVKVVSTSAAGGAKVTRTVWYAKGTGPVKVVKVSDTAGVTADKEYVLKSFTKK